MANAINNRKSGGIFVSRITTAIAAIPIPGFLALANVATSQVC
jgi:hypothetical protein